MGLTSVSNLPPRSRCGSALVWLIALGFLFVIVFCVQWYLKASAKDPDLCDDLTPWKEWRLRQTSPKPPEEPSKQQPALVKPLLFDTNARLDGEPRGQIALAISPDGAVEGAWSGQYYKKPKINFDVMGGKFEGQVYPQKLYHDEKGKDPSKLYFLAKGDFLLAETNFEKGTVFHRAGGLYVRGWLSPDYIAAGTITITTDEKYFEQFTWKASRSEAK